MAVPSSETSSVAWLRRRPVFVLALAGSLGALLAHAWVYRFLTDDAFISFRYARNLSRGLGLVFNPGLERVEGYTNFLWVLVLAGLNRLGLEPPQAAAMLGVAATVGLWVLVVRETLRRLPPSGAEWLVLVPALLLAATRSVAVWSSGGLETRAFEWLILAGTLRLVREAQGEVRGSPAFPLAGVLLVLATWTRPDGALVAASAFAASALWLARSGRLDPRRLGVRVAPFLVLVAVHLAFRRLYYHEWLPNTFYAKVGGRLAWGAGLEYAGAFALEYALWLWLPLVLLGAWRRLREGRGIEPLLFAAVILPHALYVIAIGGDHFEYRPFDLYFPLLFLLAYDGARSLARGPRSKMVVAAWLAATLIGLVELPLQAHLQCPRRHVAGFPGRALETPEGQRFLDPSRDPVYRLPGLEPIALLHREWLRHSTARFAGVRQEEHRAFYEIQVANAGRLGALIGATRLPRDAYFAMPCVGVIPYLTDLPILDRLGLTDARVAHGPWSGELTAHGKAATETYARTRGVELWTEAEPVVDVGAPELRLALRQTQTGESPWYAAEIEGGRYLLARLPLGEERITRRMPALSFHRLDTREFFETYSERCIPALRESLEKRPEDDDARRALARLLVIRGRFAPARDLYRELLERRPGDAETWLRLWACCDRLGDRAGAIEALEHARQAARAANDEGLVRGIDEQLEKAAARPKGAPPTSLPPPPD